MSGCGPQLGISHRLVYQKRRNSTKFSTTVGVCGPTLPGGSCRIWLGLVLALVCAWSGPGCFADPHPPTGLLQTAAGSSGEESSTPPPSSVMGQLLDYGRGRVSLKVGHRTFESDHLVCELSDSLLIYNEFSDSECRLDRPQDGNFPIITIWLAEDGLTVERAFLYEVGVNNYETPLGVATEVEENRVVPGRYYFGRVSLPFVDPLNLEPLLVEMSFECAAFGLSECDLWSESFTEYRPDLPVGGTM